MAYAEAYELYVENLIRKSSLYFFADYPWLLSLSVLAFSLLVAWVIIFVFDKVIKNLTKKTKTDLDDKIIGKVNKPIFCIFILGSFYAALIPLALPSTINMFFGRLILSAVIIIFSFTATSVFEILMDFWGRRWAAKTKATIDDDVLPLAKKAGDVFIYLIGLIFILKCWRVNIGGLLAGLGLAGLVIGYAVKDSLANIFGGISLILDRAFKVGDKVKLETGEVGVIGNIGLRSTRIGTYDKRSKMIIVPNNLLANMRVVNYLYPEKKDKVEVDFGVEYGTSVDKVKRVVLATVKGMDGCLKEPTPEVNFMKMGDYALSFTAKFWVENHNQVFVKEREATEKIYNALNKAKIGIPFPTRTIHIKKQ